MKRDRADKDWARLAGAARGAALAPPEMPYGFAARVVARVRAEDYGADGMREWVRLARRGLIAAGVAVALVCAFEGRSLTPGGFEAMIQSAVDEAHLAVF